ncbi:MAG: NAD-dependent epimerase/dehydratase family protein [Gammaproteobacteria bacterium]|nr:NAD-dependent epimerase/dehydratase family protein [Gammaproteobacteria bacterium]
MTGLSLITGAGGFVGRELLTQMTAAGISVRLLQRPRHDLLQPQSLSAACEGVETVYHLAAYAHVNQAQTRQLYAVNVDGTRNLLQAAITAGVKHMVYVSSILADPAYDSPRTAYGDSKWQAEQMLLSAHQQGVIRVSIIRPVNVYGVGMKGNLMTLLKMIARGLLPPLPDFTDDFSLIGVEDLCQGILSAGQLPPPPTAAIYVLSDGHAYQLKAVEKAMRQVLGKSIPGWNTPRQLFFAAALCLELAGRLLPLNNAPGLRTYRALSKNYTVDSAASWQRLGYNPRSTFYKMLPQIARTLTTNTDS